MPNIEKIYDDFLYDCYIANQRLTLEDWLYYGREEHHVEIPNRDGGVLTPCNSQYLTTYQHWIAGVLQSEVLQKRCFMCIPGGSIPQSLEDLWFKWMTQSGKQSAITNAANQTGIYCNTNRNKGRETQRQRKVGFFDPEVQKRGRSLGTARAKELGVGLYDPVIQERGRVKGVKSTMKPIILVHPTGQEEFFNNMSDACRKYNLNGSDLSKVCKGQRGRIKGFTARYVEL
jgi:hypothetical protein